MLLVGLSPCYLQVCHHVTEEVKKESCKPTTRDGECKQVRMIKWSKLVKTLSKLVKNWSKFVKKESCKPTRRKRSDDHKVAKIADTDIIFHYDDEDGGGDNGSAVWMFMET